MKGKTFLAVAVLAVAVIAIGPAQAGCSPVSKAFSLGYNDTGSFDLVCDASLDCMVGATVSPSVIGHLWQPGAYATTNDTTGLGCPDNLWLYPPSGSGTMTIFGENGADLTGDGPFCDTAVCPAGGMIVVVQTKSLNGQSASYAVGRVVETAGPPFDFARTLTNWDMVAIPRPRVTVPSPSSSGTVSVNVKIDAPASAFHAPAADAAQATATVSSYQLVSFTGGADPGRAAGGWLPVGAPIATGASESVANGIVLACPAGQHVFLATRPVFDGGVLAADYVSASTDINCSNLAAPGTPGTRGKTKVGKPTKHD